MNKEGDFSYSDWQAVEAAIVESPGVVLALGESNSGKTTWIRAAAERLSRAGILPLAVVNTDIGQATIGPPAAVALGLLRERIPERATLGSFPCEAMSFVGFVSPMGHALQLLTATKRIVACARRAGAKAVLIDTSGLVSPGFGFQLKLRKIELIAPKHLVAFQRGSELEPLLSVLSGRTGLCIHRLEISAAIRYRPPSERAHFRAGRFASYFESACRLGLQADRVMILAPILRRYRYLTDANSDLLEAEVLQREELTGLLMGLNNANDETLGLGLLEQVSADGREIRVWTPMQDLHSVRIVQLGSLRLHELMRELISKSESQP